MACPRPCWRGVFARIGAPPWPVARRLRPLMYSPKARAAFCGWWRPAQLTCARLQVGPTVWVGWFSVRASATMGTMPYCLCSDH
jgi:hypothetical protein